MIKALAFVLFVFATAELEAAAIDSVYGKA